MLDAITATRARRLLGERLSSPHMKKDRALGLTCSKICDGVRIPPRAVHKEPRRASLAQAKLAAAMLPRLRAGFTTGLREGEVGSSRHALAMPAPWPATTPSWGVNSHALWQTNERPRVRKQSSRRSSRSRFPNVRPSRSRSPHDAAPPPPPSLPLPTGDGFLLEVWPTVSATNDMTETVAARFSFARCLSASVPAPHPCDPW